MVFLGLLGAVSALIHHFYLNFLGSDVLFFDQRSVTTTCGSVIVVKIWVTKNKATIKTTTLQSVGNMIISLKSSIVKKGGVI